MANCQSDLESSNAFGPVLLHSDAAIQPVDGSVQPATECAPAAREYGKDCGPNNIGADVNEIRGASDGT